MKPYGRKDEPIKGGNFWKRDYHLHSKNGKKLDNWWEEMSEAYVDRGSIKNKVKRKIEKELEYGD